MKVRVSDIPSEGLKLDFFIDHEKITNRVHEPINNISDDSVPAPSFIFSEKIPVHGILNAEGETLELKASSSYEFTTICSRCAGPANSKEEVPIFLILKRKSKDDQDDDINYAHYEGDDLDCSTVVEDVIVQSIPYNVLCKEDCKGLCFGCGKNLNTELCVCKEDVNEVKQNPFSKLKELKIQ